jgi:hypothetical protein
MGSVGDATAGGAAGTALATCADAEAGGRSSGGGIVGAATAGGVGISWIAGDAAAGTDAAVGAGRGSVADQRLRMPITPSETVPNMMAVSPTPSATPSSGRAFFVRGATVADAASSVVPTGPSAGGRRARRSLDMSASRGGAELIRRVAGARQPPAAAAMGAAA